MKFVQIKNDITDNVDGISDNAFRIYAFILQHDLEKYSPSYKIMSLKLKRSKKTIARGIKELENANLIMMYWKNKFLKIELINNNTI